MTAPPAPTTPTTSSTPTTSPAPAAPPGADPREALAERVVDDLVGSLETFSVYLGLELGLYQALADLGAATDAQVASRAGIAPRYAREWLEQQTAAGYVACDDPSLPAAERRYYLPDGHAEVFLDPDSPYHAVPGTRMLAGVAGILPQLLDAYRSGGGVPYADFGRGIRHGIAAFNRPMFTHELTGWLDAVPGLGQRLRAAPPARVLDLGCGLGGSAIALARAFPRLVVLGVDLDETSVAEARASASAAGVADRVSFDTRDAAAVAATDRFDLVTIFEALHDMGDPAGVLRAVRSSLTDGGAVLIGDERVADTFPGPADQVERFQYGWSVLHCLPATLAEDPVEAAGTALRAPTVHRWATEAGFTHFEVLPVDNPFWRFYHLHG